MSGLAACARIRPFILARADRELPPARRPLVESHLHSCSSCQQWQEASEADRRAVGVLDPQQSPEGFADAIMAAVHALASSPARSIPRENIFRGIAGLGLLLLLMSMVGAMWAFWPKARSGTVVQSKNSAMSAPAKKLVNIPPKTKESPRDSSSLVQPKLHVPSVEENESAQTVKTNKTVTTAAPSVQKMRHKIANKSLPPHRRYRRSRLASPAPPSAILAQPTRIEPEEAYQQGLYFEQEGKMEESLRAYERAVFPSLTPTNGVASEKAPSLQPEAALALGRLYEQMGCSLAASELYSRIVFDPCETQTSKAGGSR